VSIDIDMYYILLKFCICLFFFGFLVCYSLYRECKGLFYICRGGCCCFGGCGSSGCRGLFEILGFRLRLSDMYCALRVRIVGCLWQGFEHSSVHLR